MENTQLPTPTEDDVFNSRPNSSSKASSSRIHFPANDAGFQRPTPRTRPDTQKALAGFNPPNRRGSPLNPQNATQFVDPKQRRPWLPDPGSPVDATLRQRRNPSFGQSSLSRLDFPLSDSLPQENILETTAFSDEYDLSHEDPRILQDVQRALKLKARREARLRRESLVTPEKAVSDISPPSHRSEASSSKILGPPLSPTKAPFSPSTSIFPRDGLRKISTSTSSEVDFSPATGPNELSTPSHPVPCSIDNGRTFDWSSTYSDEGDKKWSISLVKRKDKDRLPPLATMMDEQEQLHKAKLDALSRNASPQTIRKADIISRQLSRQYAMIYDSLETKKKPLNLAEISRWYGSQPEGVRNALEKSEPLTWLKHLERRSLRTTRSRYNFSALVMAEYLLPNNSAHMQTIPEDSTVLDSVVSITRKSRSPSFLSTQGASALGLNSSFSTGLVDDRVSFEPLADSKRDSLDAMSRKSADSTFSSTRSGSSKAALIPLSPTSTRSDSKGTGNNMPVPKRTRSPGSSSSESLASSTSKPAEQEGPDSLFVPGLSVLPPSSERLADPTTGIPLALTNSGSSSSSQNKKRNSSLSNQSLTSLKDAPKPRVQPPFDRAAKRRKKQRENREAQLNREYEAKAAILHETKSHNHRIRQFLNRISVTLRDYDSIQHTSGPTPGVDQRKIPKNVLDSFSHDPSAVTSSTRRLRGWRAVEDINQRVIRQRAILNTFINSNPDVLVNTGCLLDEPIENILQALAEVEVHKDEIVQGADEVANVLESVQEQYAVVKQIYNDTVSRVSTVYPELSHIIALEESYRDQYQQFSDLGMDALTLLLDTVTPFWRTYGKTIGEDVRDFLIIPLYRNEFTGEVKRYPIKEFPRRSLGHWFGLVLFFLLSMGVNVLQVRAAITSTLNCRLQLIPYDSVRWTALPFFWVGIIIQWVAVVFEFAIVFMQLGVITWWTAWSVKLLT